MAWVLLQVMCDRLKGAKQGKIEIAGGGLSTASWLHRLAVKGAEGAAKPFALDRADGFLLLPLSPASSRRNRPPAGRGSQTRPACPFFLDVRHGRIQYFEQAVVGRKNRVAPVFVFRRSAVHCFLAAKLTFDNPECMLRFAAH